MSPSRLLLDRVRMHPSGFKNGAIPTPPPKAPPGIGSGAAHGQGVGKGKGIGQGAGGGRPPSLQALAGAFVAVSSTGVVTPTNPVTPAPFSQLQSITADGTKSAFDFQNITGQYNHLQVVVVARSAVAATSDQMFVTFNNDAAAHYDYNYANGQGAGMAVTQATAANGIGVASVAGATGTANYPGSFVVDVPFYAKTTFFKQALLTDFGQRATGATDLFSIRAGGTWRNTAAITRLTVSTSGGANIVSGSRAILYGVI